MPNRPILDRRLVPISLGLVLLTFLAYWPLFHNGFVAFDDPQYILENTHVTAGLTWSGVTWALTSGYAANWHPLTWLSHMLDYSLFGVQPGGHHLTSLTFHAIVSVLLFILLFRLTTRLWHSALVAALFALHPLHVESVAWASERKDVLSALFFLLTLLAYAQYTKTRDAALDKKNKQAFVTWYALALALFALGLMSKPMLVTTPFVLLLLDYWPLQRWHFGLHESKPARLLLEKTPFLLLAIAASVVTFLVQKADGAVASFEHRPLGLRITNAILSYIRYLGKTFWPVDLSVMYPYPKIWPLLTVIVSTSLLLAICALVFLRAKKAPYLFTGWFWFLGMLVPTIGLVQVGRQAMADRYMYLPSIGLFIILVWGGHALLSGLWDFATRTALPSNGILRRSFTAIAIIIPLLLCAAATFRQVTFWRNGETLFRHAIAATHDKTAGYGGLGVALLATGRPQEALPYLQESLTLDPSSADGQFALGTVLLQLGRASEAVPHLETVVASFPRNLKARINLGCALFNLGKLEAAELQFAAAVKLDASNPQPHYALGTALLAQSKIEAAVAELSAAVNLNPKYVSEAVKLNPEAPLLRYNLGTILLMQSHVPEAIEQLSAAVQLDGDFREAHRNLAIALIREGRRADGIAHFREALRLNPADADLHADLGLALLEENQPEEALCQFREGLKLRPGDPKLQQRITQAQVAVTRR